MGPLATLGQNQEWFIATSGSILDSGGEGERLVGQTMERSYIGSGSQQADRCTGGRHLRTGSQDIVDFILGEAREGTCGGRGAKLKYWMTCLWEWRWNVGTSGEWSSRGLVKVVV